MLITNETNTQTQERQHSQLGHGTPVTYQYKKESKKKKKKKSQPASVNLPFSFVSFIAVGTYETADRSEVSNPCAVLSVQPTALCGLRVVLSGETTSWVMFVKVYLVFPQTMTALFM